MRKLAPVVNIGVFDYFFCLVTTSELDCLFEIVPTLIVSLSNYVVGALDVVVHVCSDLRLLNQLSA